MTWPILKHVLVRKTMHDFTKCHGVHCRKLKHVFPSLIGFVLLFSVTPVPCKNECYCHHQQNLRVNVYDCSNKTTFPKCVQNNTDWLVVSNAHLKNIPGDIPYIANISSLNVSKNDISNIYESTLDVIIKNGKLEILDLSKNNFTEFPKGLKNIRTSQEIYLSHNPIQCNCNMLWMVEWLNNFTAPDGS